MAAPVLPPHRRLAAWVVCGPLGHLYGGVADWVELFLRWQWEERFRPARLRWRSSSGRRYGAGS
ncbi:MAG TPA: hypothetical protein VF533_08180 [Solirubrobacteraceae bacterium]